MPLITRKAASLYEDGFGILQIPAILNCFAQYSSLGTPENYLETGNGVLHVNTIEMDKMIKNKALVVFSGELLSSFSQGFLKLRIPEFNNKFDEQFIISTNVNGVLSGVETYEYVLDSSYFTFGRKDPFSKTKI